ncbi:MAG TPA: tetratricopeptide repeat protein [Acidiphilium sp.]|nr:tetratricopeptide repeat protein [Acidiphilium sp.]HQU24355.1 tetratricopeptide repeat protein [Acidiphilium sp.]
MKPSYLRSGRTWLRLMPLTSLILVACAAGSPRMAAADAKPDAVGVRGALVGDILAAQYAGRTGDLTGAAGYFAKALQLDPTDQQLRARAFAAALVAQSPTRITLARTVKTEALAAMVLGDHALIEGHAQQAATHYAQLPKTGPLGLLRPLLIAWADAGAGHVQQGIDRLKPLSVGAPFAPVYALHAALIADDGQREAEAARFYARAEAESGAPDLQMAQALASWQARQGNQGNADAVLHQLVQAHPQLRLALPALIKAAQRPAIANARDGAAAAYLALAGVLNQPNQILLQQILLDAALNLRPDFATARLLRAHIAMITHQPASAATILQGVAPNNPLYPLAVMQRAEIAGNSGKGAAMVPDLLALAKAAPRSAAPLALAGDIERNGKHYAAAKRDYSAALTRLGAAPPSSAWSLYYGRAIAEDKSGDWPAAKRDLQTALTLAPDQPFVLNYLGYSEARQGKHLAAAQKLIEQALQVDPNEGAIIDSLGYVLYRRGQIAKALTVQTQAVEHAPDDAEVNMHLAEILDAAGQHLAGQYQWARALGLHPNAAERAKIKIGLQRDQAAGGV